MPLSTKYIWRHTSPSGRTTAPFANLKGIEKAGHPFELTPRDFVNVNIDLNIHGVGCNDGWGAQTQEKYTIDSNKLYSYAFILSCDDVEWHSTFFKNFWFSLLVYC